MFRGHSSAHVNLTGIFLTGIGGRLYYSTDSEVDFTSPWPLLPGSQQVLPKILAVWFLLSICPVKSATHSILLSVLCLPGWAQTQEG